MSGSSLTVPPPRDDDHDDVAWALRAASAQWRRDAVPDAVGWVRRAAETAVEVGAVDRAAELTKLANSLERGPAAGGPVAVAPPPPPGALSIGSDDVEVDVDMDDVEMIDDLDDLDDIEDLDDVEEVEEVEDLDDVDDVEEVTDDDDIVFDDVAESAAPSANYGASPAPAPLAPASQKAPSAPAEQPAAESRRRSTTSSGADLPPSMRPSPSGLDLAEDLDDDEFGELEFEDEPPTNKVSVSEAPPAPDLGEVRMDGPSQIPLEDQTAAEYATSQHPGDARQDHEEIEKELGVDLSVRVQGQTASAPVAPSAPAPPSPPQDPVHVSEAHASFGQSIAMEPPQDSVSAPPPLEDDPFGSAVSPVPGRASVRPSEPPPGGDLQVSAESEPYGLAPSAELPPAEPRQETRGPGIEPPSRPSAAPPPQEMAEPDDQGSLRPSGFPSGHPSAPPAAPALSNAPEPDEVDDMFAAISKPPAKPDVTPEPEPAELAAPPPPAIEEAPPAPAVPAASEASGLPLEVSEDAIVLDGIDLLEIQGLQDLPDDSAQELARSAELVTLEKGEEVSSFGVALVTHGAVQLMPTVADAPCALARKGEVLFVKGTLPDEVAVRVVGFEPGSRVALFSKDALDQATNTSPWVADELAEVADKYLAFAGAVLGPLGDSLDDTFRFMVFEKCSVKPKAPGVMIAEAGKAMDGMYILGGGTLELLGADGSVEEELGMGDFVFPETVLSAAPASQSVRVGKHGALLLHANRMGAHELLATCPPFIELLAG